jgi:hypothetical protein
VNDAKRGFLIIIGALVGIMVFGVVVNLVKTA